MFDEVPLISCRTEAGVALLLRPWRESDLRTIVRACSDPESQRWLPLPSPYTLEDARGFIAMAEIARRRGEGLHLAVTREPTDEVVGCVGLKATDEREKVTEIGYWTVPEHRRHGYITSAVAALSSWALTQELERVELRVEPANTASRCVARAAGFREESRAPAGGIIRGRCVELILYRRDRIVSSPRPET